jgi:hypothetical protein
MLIHLDPKHLIALNYSCRYSNGRMMTDRTEKS